MHTTPMSIPIVQPWFERRDIGGAITLLLEPYVNPFLQANIWHVRGRDRDLLIDSGLGICSLRAFAPDLFDGAVIAVASHAHYDHIGGLGEFQARVAHPLDADEMRHPDFASLLVSDFPAEFHDEFAADGDELVTAYPAADFDPAAYTCQPVEPTQLVDEGDLIDLGDRAFAVLHLPGHTPGSIALWEAATGILFSGDVIYDGLLLDELTGSDIPAYIRSMRRLRALPISIVHAGHYPSFGRDRFVQLIDAYLQHRA